MKKTGLSAEDKQKESENFLKMIEQETKGQKKKEPKKKKKDITGNSP